MKEAQTIKFTYFVDVQNDFTPNAFDCADMRVHVLVDGEEEAISQWLGYENRSTPLPLDTGIVTIGNVGNATHLLTLVPESRPGGCNTDYLHSWGGTLVVYS